MGILYFKYFVQVAARYTVPCGYSQAKNLAGHIIGHILGHITDHVESVVASIVMNIFGVEFRLNCSQRVCLKAFLVTTGHRWSQN